MAVEKVLPAAPRVDPEAALLEVNHVKTSVLTIDKTLFYFFQLSQLNGR